MKTFILLLASVFILSCGGQKTPKASTDLVNIAASADSTTPPKKTGKAKIQFEKLVHDFGTITQGEVVEYEFIFTNTGDADLLVASANASCGCTIPEYPKEPISPGRQGKIKVKFNSELRIDRFTKEIFVTANTEPMETVLTIGGNILPKPTVSLPNSH